ncbi:MAG: putative glycoside hydrolase, partial [Eubacteriales bacterium]|nr:putative glycoside hydrolase [Eubacteriales bacterium]
MMKNKKQTLMVNFLLLTGLLTGCGRLEAVKDLATTPAPVVVERGETESPEPESGAAEPELQTEEIVIDAKPQRTPVQVKGIYISAYVAGTPSMVDNLLAELDRTEGNALVIDLKDDFGRVACKMDSPMIEEIGSVKTYIQDVEGLMQKLDDHGIYAIARIPAFRDAWLGDVRPEWCIQKADGTVFKDRDGNAWVNPYKKEAWDYLAEIAIQAKRLGFEEVQFDYVRFCTERGMQEAVFREEDVQGRSRTDIILEFMEYMYDRLTEEGLFVSADVFGAIINSDINADSVGQIYGELAKHLDYISPMIYPSHYGDGNYGIEHPDMQPYETICAALNDSRKELYFAGQDGSHIAQVRPWLQDFTASWLANYIPYGGPEVRQQIQAVYDCGYDEWLLWDAACTYDWDGLLTPEEAEAERIRIDESRAALPETTYAAETTAASAPETNGNGQAAAAPAPETSG